MIYNHYRLVLQSKSLESSRAFLTQKPLVLRICEHFPRSNRQILFRIAFSFFLHLHRTNRQELLRPRLQEGVSRGGHDLRPKIGNIVTIPIHISFIDFRNKNMTQFSITRLNHFRCTQIRAIWI